MGCLGGYPDDALNFIAKSGTVLGSDYPYTSGTTGYDGTC